MNVLLTGARQTQDQARRLVLQGLGWASYEKLLDALAEVHVRTTYDRGTLEIMSPLPIHEFFKRWFGLLFPVLSEELGIPLWGFSSTTFRRQDQQQGLEPDECFYLASLPRLRDRRAIDLSVDPPPDLAVEVDITRTCLDRFSVYGSLGVPEVWRFDGEALEVHLLAEDGSYAVAPGSLALPFLPLGEIPPLLQQCYDLGDEGAGLRALRTWVRDRVLPLYQAASRQTPPGGAAG
jgi:Uma2 family endonuclease